MEKKTKQIAVKITESMYNSLKDYATKHEWTIAHAACRLIENSLKNNLAQ